MMNARRITATLLAAAVLSGCSSDTLPTAVAPTAQPSRVLPSEAVPVLYPPKGKVFLGVQTNLGPYDFTAVDAFTNATSHKPAVLQFSQGWAEDHFDTTRLTAIADRGMLPIISWEPWDYTHRANRDQPAYRLATITAGRYDTYIQSWADGIAALPFPVVIRLAHEMNGNWYPWSEQTNNNHPGDYIKAWHHIHHIFTTAHADNVTWLWSPNVTYNGAPPLYRLYPGDAYVDWIGLSGYYGTAGRTSYISFNQIFNATLKQLKTFTRKPIVITETGATNTTGQQTRWITQMFQQLPQHPEIIGLIWFETTKEIDWRIAHTPAAAQAFGKAATDPRYNTPWTPNAIPRS